MSVFRMQVVDERGELAATWHPGERAEIDLIQRVADRVAAQPVGYLRSTAAVRAAVVQALTDELRDLKSRIHPS